MIALHDPDSVRGATVRDRDGENIGTVDELYFDDATDKAEWMTVRTGLFGMKTTFVPVEGAQPEGDDELRVGTERREAGRARLRKYVVTEEVSKTVPVQREEVRVEREPITDANIDNALDGPAISEEEHEVVLQEETPVVEKRAVPKERVRLEKDTYTDEETVSDQVRKERIDGEGDVR